MGITYESLSSEVRSFMLQELKLDIEQRKLYISKRLNDAGTKNWSDLIRDAISEHDDNWIAIELRSRGYLRDMEERKKANGGTSMAKVPVTAADTLAEGEFNRYYARGVCAFTLANGGTLVEIYRGKHVENPRPESTIKIGQQLDASLLLEDLRSSQGVDTALGVPAGPNSGLTIRMIS